MSGRLVEDILGAMAVAIRNHDFKGAVALWKMLAVEDPDLAKQLYDIVQGAP